MKTTALISGILVFMLALGVARADELSADSANTMSCGSNFISVGDPEDAVLSTCGEPDFRDGNRWTYSSNPGSFIYELTFGEGRIIGIHTRERD